MRVFGVVVTVFACFLLLACSDQKSTSSPKGSTSSTNDLGQGWAAPDPVKSENTVSQSEFSVKNNISLPSGSFSKVPGGDPNSGLTFDQIKLNFVDEIRPSNETPEFIDPVTDQEVGYLPYALLVKFTPKSDNTEFFVTRTDTAYLTESMKVIYGHQLRKGSKIRKRGTVVTIESVVSGSYRGNIRAPKVENTLFEANGFLVFQPEINEPDAFPRDGFALESSKNSPMVGLQNTTDNSTVKLSDGALFTPHQSFNSKYTSQGEFVEIPVQITPETDADPLGINRSQFNNSYTPKLEELFEKLNASTYGYKNPSGSGAIRFFVDYSCRNRAIQGQCPLWEANAYATFDPQDNYRPIVGINYGLIRKAGLSLDAISLVTSHEIGHHLPVIIPNPYASIQAPRHQPHIQLGHNAGAFCEAPSDYFGARDVQPELWQDDHIKITTKGSRELMAHFFVGKQPPITRCGHPPKECRKMFYETGMNRVAVNATHKCRSKETLRFSTNLPENDDGLNSFSGVSRAEEIANSISWHFSAPPNLNYERGEIIGGDNYNFGEFEKGGCSIEKFNDGSTLQIFTVNATFKDYFASKKTLNTCSCELLSQYYADNVKVHLPIPDEQNYDTKLRKFEKLNSSFKKITGCQY